MLDDRHDLPLPPPEDPETSASKLVQAMERVEAASFPELREFRERLDMMLNRRVMVDERDSLPYLVNVAGRRLAIVCRQRNDADHIVVESFYVTVRLPNRLRDVGGRLLKNGSIYHPSTLAGFREEQSLFATPEEALAAAQKYLEKKGYRIDD